MESTTPRLAASRNEGREELLESEKKADDEPDSAETHENPKEERRLAHRQPRQLFALEEEAGATRRAAGTVVLDDLARHRLGWVECRAPLCIAVQGRLPGLGEVLVPTRHVTSLALATQAGGRLR
jgi:hypothetical protein